VVRAPKYNQKKQTQSDPLRRYTGPYPPFLPLLCCYRAATSATGEASPRPPQGKFGRQFDLKNGAQHHPANLEQNKN
jgi:hypothetical protein